MARRAFHHYFRPAGLRSVCVHCGLWQSGREYVRNGEVIRFGPRRFYVRGTWVTRERAPDCCGRHGSPGLPFVGEFNLGSPPAIDDPAVIDSGDFSGAVEVIMSPEKRDGHRPGEKHAEVMQAAIVALAKATEVAKLAERCDRPEVLELIVRGASELRDQAHQLKLLAAVAGGNEHAAIGLNREKREDAKPATPRFHLGGVVVPPGVRIGVADPNSRPDIVVTYTAERPPRDDCPKCEGTGYTYEDDGHGGLAVQSCECTKAPHESEG